MVDPVPQPHRRCPLCGQPNDCAPAACGRFDVDCWCTSSAVSAQALARVSASQQGQACLCARCASGEPNDGMSLSVHDDLPPEADRIDEGLGEFNQRVAPLHEVQPLSCFARDDAGVLLGGVVGRTWGACAELQQLWVDESRRRQGVGARLVMAFEARARERGCRTFYLETFSFQAPALYRDLGYETKLAIEGFGHGIVKYTMLKTLD
jgi:GNAT superfamily N-acetyltransferase